MRLLLLAWEHPPRVHGGLGRHVHGLSRALVRLGHEVHVVAGDHPSAPPVALDDGVCVHRAVLGSGGSRWPVRGWPDEGWLAEVHAVNASMRRVARRVAAGAGIDLLHAHDWMVGDAARAVARSTGLPLVVTVHATERGRHQGWLPGATNRWIDARERALAAAAQGLVVCSRAMAEQVATHLGVARAEVVPNGVEVAAPPTRAAPAPAARATVLFVGRLEHEKGLHVLLHAVRRLRSDGRDLRLVVAGDGTQREAVEALVARLRLRSRVALVGFCGPERLAALHAAASVAVVPSLYEPFGMVALEAMALGTPVVASRVGGLAEVVDDGATGLLVPPDDEAALAAALARVLDRPGLARRLVAAGRRRAAGATWEEAARRTTAVYEATLST
jgi:glycogen synthase